MAISVAIGDMTFMFVKVCKYMILYPATIGLCKFDVDHNKTKLQ